VLRDSERTARLLQDLLPNSVEGSLIHINVNQRG